MKECLSTYKVSSFGRTDIGLVRQNNEDVWKSLSDHRFYILADGMGGHKAGEIAAKETVDRLSINVEKLLKSPKKQIKQQVNLIRDIILKVNKEVYEKSREGPELHGMGTTLCCTYFHDQGVIFAHVGDSRIYRFDGKELHQLTRDHSLVNEMIDLGELSERNVAGVSYKHRITRAIGTEPHVEVAIQISHYDHDDLFLMCSDGLSDMISPKMIENILKESVDLQGTIDRLINAAIEQGGKDNITAVLMRIEPIDEHISR